jgi:hypothetical protein
VTEPYADWFPAGHTPDPLDFEQQVVGTPVEDDDLGSVYVNWMDRERDVWWASWQRGEESRDLHDVSRAEAIAWALEQPASARWIFSSDDDTFVPLTGNSP